PGKMRWEEVEQWVFQPGIPKDAPQPASSNFAAIDRQRSAFLEGTLTADKIDTTFLDTDTADKLDTRQWNTQEWMYFLDGLPKKTPLAKIEALDKVWHLTGTPNAEIGMRWYVHAIAAGDKTVWPAAAEHASRIGRMYLTTPVYRAFAATPDGLAYAEKTYAKAKNGYHPMTQAAVERIFAAAKAKPAAAAKGN
ncbi:MAG TPA: leukotriene A4 hydrolase C-terminal domain-containing protein, partial [Rhodanobacteraceae bacterium]|nr:leukotriene A4 hydrolase C-terminal domain-containing protein [Rhodanobacteraceae bacterium]